VHLLTGVSQRTPDLVECGTYMMNYLTDFSSEVISCPTAIKWNKELGFLTSETYLWFPD